jgi:DNA transformation protein
MSVRAMPRKIKANEPATQAASRSLARLANLGPKSAQFLRNAGITSHEQLKQLGSVKAYSIVKHVEPSASLNLLWALEGALSGLHWREVRLQRSTARACCSLWKLTNKAIGGKPLHSSPSLVSLVVGMLRPNPSIEGDVQELSLLAAPHVKR